MLLGAKNPGLVVEVLDRDQLFDHLFDALGRGSHLLYSPAKDGAFAGQAHDVEDQADQENLCKSHGDRT